MRLVTSVCKRKIIFGRRLPVRVRVRFTLSCPMEDTRAAHYVNWGRGGPRPQLQVGVDVEGGRKNFVSYAGPYLFAFGAKDGLAPSPRPLRDLGFVTKTQGVRLEFS